MARRSLKPQLNQIRSWVQQGRTDAWIAHQLDVSVSELVGFKREHELAPPEPDDGGSAGAGGAAGDDEQDLRAQDEALIAAALDAEPDSEDLAALGAMVVRRPEEPVATAFDIDRASTEIATAFDPTVARPTMVDRVLDGVIDAVGSVDADPTSPVELTPDLDLPAWRFLRDNAPEWLLPGAGTLPADTVVALTTNPAFVDTFLLGLNAQVVAELRFRNYPLIPGWTPVRTFWDRANAATGDVDDDIVDIGTWPASSSFGAATHQTASASSADLVVLFNTPLFREYPGTLVYLVPALRDA
ncbi:MAG: hypothetical protein M3340_09035, partial [Actinomycetota bacterium]|nr:hypothetical protein [Actinomycetota bacterium]